jgi:hypothetical protein
MPPKKGNEPSTLNVQHAAATHYMTTMHNKWIAYHDHKEHMAFAGTGLYLTGATAFMLIRRPSVLGIGWIGVLAILVTAFGGWLFVFWQFNRRAEAAYFSRACGKVLLDWAGGNFQEDALKPIEDHEGRWQATALLEAYKEAKASFKWHQHPWFSGGLTLGLMALWGFAAICHIVPTRPMFIR